MENSVTLTYTDIIRENESLKEAIKRFKKMFEADIGEYASQHSWRLPKTKEGLQEIVDEEDSKKIATKTGYWDYEIKDIAEKYEGAFSYDDVLEELASDIKAMATDRIGEMEEDNG